MDGNRIKATIGNALILIGLLLTNPSIKATTNDLDLKVEPPFWWTDFKSSKLQLMVFGKDISLFDVISRDKNIIIESIEKTDNSDYLFINLVLNKETAGSFKLSFHKNNETYFLTYELKKRHSKSALRKGFSSEDVIYLITPDRFANGDYSNDSDSNYEDKLNKEFEGGRHGGDIQGIIDNLDYLEDMGFTQLWLNPVLENAQEKYSYHGYSTTDYYKVDPRMGSNELYVKLSREAEIKQIGLIKDIVLNHIGSGHWWMKSLPSNDWLNFSGKCSPTNHKRETLHDPYAAEEDKKQFADGWFVPTMPDLNQRNSLLKNYLIQNSIWWIEYANLSGLRIDTYPYSDKNFLSEYTKAIMEEYPNFSIVGEEWSINPAVVAYWQRGTKRHDDYESNLNSVMDFPLQAALVEGLSQKDSWKDGWQRVYSSLATDFLYGEPENIMVFADNHDMSRIFTQLNHDIELAKLAMTFILTTRGIPQFFYGTEILMNNKGTDSHGIIRTDFPGGWEEDKKNAFTGQGLTDSEQQFQSYIKKLLNWRKGSTAIKKGKMKHYAPSDGVYVYFRQIKNETVMVVLNKNKESRKINPSNYSSVIGQAINSKQGTKDIINGKVISLAKPFEVPAKSAMILEIN